MPLVEIAEMERPVILVTTEDMRMISQVNPEETRNIEFGTLEAGLSNLHDLMNVLNKEVTNISIMSFLIRGSPNLTTATLLKK